LRKYLGSTLRDLASQKECKILEGNLRPDHVHILISIPPKYSVAQVVGFIKGKSSISIARTYMGRRKNYTGQKFWARGYHVSTVGRDEEVIKPWQKKMWCLSDMNAEYVAQMEHVLDIYSEPAEDKRPIVNFDEAISEC